MANETKPLVVCVSASFAGPDELTHILRKYARHYNDDFAWFGSTAFTARPMVACDAMLIFNTPSQRIRTVCDEHNVLAFMMEPGDFDMHPWMFKGLRQYHRVYSPIARSSNTIPSHGFLGWMDDHSYPLLKQLAAPSKTKHMSCIASGLNSLAGHRLRNQFIARIRQEIPEVEFFGRESNFIPQKSDGLLPFRYSIAIENSALPHYFTEKINDCFLAYTVPVYHGCTNIADYYPEKSFISIDINNPLSALETIRRIMTDDDWASRMDAVKEARELVLEKYQPLAAANALLRPPSIKSRKKLIDIKPVHRSAFNRARSSLQKWVSA
jgi:hypothetical protein